MVTVETSGRLLLCPAEAHGLEGQLGGWVLANKAMMAGRAAEAARGRACPGSEGRVEEGTRGESGLGRRPVVSEVAGRPLR